MKICKKRKSENTFPIIALICAILSAGCWWLDSYLFNVFTKVMEIIAIALSITSLEQKKGSRIMAIGALIIAILAVFATLLFCAECLIFYFVFADEIEAMWEATWEALRGIC